MEKTISQYFSSLEFGKIQHHKNMAVIPLLTSADSSPNYLTLEEALDKRLLKIVELNDGGSVPELKAVCTAEIPVLLLDGEEVAGAKQNRVLNTSVLLKEQSETIIPVSCTEQGRWSYTTEEFAASANLIAPQVRRKKSSSVNMSLKETSTFRSDQGAVWDGIEEMADLAKVESNTGAMSDIFEAKMAELEVYLQAFDLVPRQKGLLVIINAEVIGFDIVSLESAYAQYHKKLVKSYVMDALLEQQKKSDEPSVDSADTFLKEVQKCNEKRYESTGHGWDYRYEGKNMVGSALVYDDKVIHSAFFRISDSEKVGNMASFRRRRGFRVD